MSVLSQVTIFDKLSPTICFRGKPAEVLSVLVLIKEFSVWFQYRKFCHAKGIHIFIQILALK